MLQSNSKLKSLINDLWNTFWSGGIANPLTAIEQITYLIFMKRLDDLEAKQEEMQVTKEPYKSRFEGLYKPYVNESAYPVESIENPTQKQEMQIALEKAKEPRPKQELRWSQFKRITPTEKMLDHVRFNVFPFIKALNGDTSPFTKSMSNAVFIIEKPTLLFEAINKIEDIFKEIEKDAKEGGQAFQDIQGDVYEMLLSEIATAGKNGQFRTPRHIIKLMAELVEPKLGDKIADPACGTGGFLLGAYQYILTDLIRKQDPKKKLKPDEDGFERGTTSASLTPDVIKILSDSFYGFDIDTTMVRLGLMNLMMHGIDTPHIDYKDTLSKSFNEDNQYNIIMANPPFTGNIDKGDINDSLQLPTTKTELLFIERIFTMLRTGGTAAIIVPQGVLFGSGKAFVMAREKLVEECELKAVISLPSGVFKPYAGVSTSILLFTKASETESTWFYDMTSDGYSLDDKRAKLEGNGDLQNIVLRYKNRDTQTDIDRTAKCFFVPKSELVENAYDLSISKYKTVIYDEVEFKDPAIIFKELEDLESNISRGLAQLREMIN